MPQTFRLHKGDGSHHTLAVDYEGAVNYVQDRFGNVFTFSHAKMEEGVNIVHYRRGTALDLGEDFISTPGGDEGIFTVKWNYLD